MDLQASVQLVSDYRPGDDSTSLRSSLLSAVRQLRAALVNTEQLGEGLRPLIKALITASVYLPEEWEDILQVLRQLLANTAVPWLHRAFLLKALPGMLVDTPTAQQLQHGDALCEVLVRWSLPPHDAEEGDMHNAQEDALQSTNLQERRVARTSLLGLPPEYATSIVKHLVSQLPHSLSTCVAVVSNPSTHTSLKKAFEEWLSHSSASPHMLCVMEIEKTLKEHFPGFGTAKCEQLCTTLLAKGPLKNVNDIEAFQKELQALEMEVSCRTIIGSRMSLVFIFKKFTEVMDFVYSPQQNCLVLSEEDSFLPISVIQSLVQLADMALVTDDSVTSEEIRKASACLIAIDSEDAALDAPLPFVEYVLHIVLRTLPCMSTTDEGLQQILDELARVVGVLLPVVECAVLKIQSSLLYLSDESNVANDKAKSEESESLTKNESFSEEQHKNTVTALRVAQTVAQLCRISVRKFQSDGHGHQTQPVEESSHKTAKKIAAGVRGITPSWRREKLQRPQAPTQVYSRQTFQGTGGTKRELQHSHYQPRRPRDRGGFYHPLKRQRRNAPQ